MNLKQVAAVAGVSVSTVSRVLNGKSYVNEETRRIVTEAIRKTNYQPNALAQSLKMGRSNTICLMIPSIENLMFPKLTRGVEDEARKNGMTVFLCNTDEDAAIEKSYLETMKQRWIDGFIVCSLSSDAPHIRSLRDEGYPLVLVNRFEESDIGKVDTVTSDNFQIGYDATRYLARIGHKRIAIVCGREELLLYRERFRTAVCPNGRSTSCAKAAAAMVFIIKSVSWQSKGSCPTPSSAPVTPRRLWLCTRCTIWGCASPRMWRLSAWTTSVCPPWSSRRFPQ